MERENELLKESIVMANELDVAGEFIYAALEKLNRMDSFEQVGDDFYFLYHLAVGIERVQKVLLVIINDVEKDKVEGFLKKIKSHDHMMLHGKIKDKIHISFSPEQNELLRLLSKFYDAERYGRFDYFSYDFNDKNLLIEYVETCCKKVSFDYSLGRKTLINTDDVMETFGRVIGRICQKYYEIIEKESRARNIYCYELRCDSAAERVFCGTEDKGSYQKKMERESRAIKELLLYLRSPGEINKFLDYVDELDSLPFDIAMIQDYVADLCNKTVSIDLMNEVEFMYEEFVENRKEREQKLSLIGDKGVMFDIAEEDW